jgi:hypothetical protein
MAFKDFKVTIQNSHFWLTLEIWFVNDENNKDKFTLIFRQPLNWQIYTDKKSQYRFNYEMEGLRFRKNIA